MPPKKLIGKKNDKKNEKKKKKQQGVAADASKLLKEIIKEYDMKCDYYYAAPCIPLRRQLRQFQEESKLLHRFLIDPKDRRKVEYWEDEQLPLQFAPLDANSEERSSRRKTKKKIKKEPQNLVKVLPLLEALRNKRYIHIQELFIWEVLMEYDDICILTAMIARSIYQFIRIELVDCFVSPKSLSKLIPSVNLCRTLQEVVLDFNEFGDEGCQTICQGLTGNRWLLQLSLCYCNLTKVSGLYLGELVAKTPIREIYLDGNELKAEGVILLLNLLCQGAEIEAQDRLDQKLLKEEQEAAQVAAESKPRYNIDDDEPVPENLPENATSESQSPAQATPSKSAKKGKKKNKRKKGKKGKKKSKSFLPPPPPVGPQIEKIRLADNGIDQMGRGGNFAPMRCMQLFKTIISNSKDLEEIDLFGNDIGDLGSRQLLEGLIIRKGNKLPQIGLRVGHRINQDTFDLISKLAPGAKKKKKGKGKK